MSLHVMSVRSRLVLHRSFTFMLTGVSERRRSGCAAFVRSCERSYSVRGKELVFT